MSLERDMAREELSFRMATFMKGNMPTGRDTARYKLKFY